eukprot:9583793-Karenia_brevis.AAC.1
MGEMPWEEAKNPKSSAVSDVISFNAAISEVALEVDGPSPLIGCAHGDADDVISFNAAISE